MSTDNVNFNSGNPNTNGKIKLYDTNKKQLTTEGKVALTFAAISIFSGIMSSNNEAEEEKAQEEKTESFEEIALGELAKIGLSIAGEKIGEYLQNTKEN